VEFRAACATRPRPALNARASGSTKPIGSKNSTEAARRRPLEKNDQGRPGPWQGRA